MIVINDMRLPLCEQCEIEPRAVDMALKTVNLTRSSVKTAALRRASYDSRHGKISIVCSATIELDDAEAEQRLALSSPHITLKKRVAPNPVCGTKEPLGRPVVVGFGPAGMFAAYILAQYGYRPIVLERGGDLDSRAAAVENFFAGGRLDCSSNVQFGEGGAGTFSDGKLTTRINDPLCDYVLETFVKHGAPDDVLWRAKPHVGTDNLRVVVRSMRSEIIRLGGEVHFLSALDDIKTGNGAVCAAVSGGREIACSALLLCCGHSARDTLEMLARHGVCLEAKAFSVGARIEHPQELIDRAVFGRFAKDKRLPHGEYTLSARVAGRAVYTFCMCPGGTVIAAASKDGMTVTNGMSCYARDGHNANAAVVAAVSPQDFGSSPFDGYDFRDALERAAYAAGGESFAAPAQSVGGFLKRSAVLGRVEPTYPRGVAPYDLNALFSKEIADTLAGGIAAFGKKLRGFDDADALLTAPETRTSSPVRITRGDSRESISIEGLYPCGEGAGYAGGIMSAAVDGIKSALAVMEKYKAV